MDLNKLLQIVLVIKQNENALLQHSSQQFLLHQVRACRRNARERAAKIRKRTMNHLQEVCLMHSVAVQSVLKFPLRKRLLGSYQRSGNWWDSVVPGYDDLEFRHHFRMNRSTFSQLCIALQDDLKPADSRTSPGTLGVEKKVAIALFRLSSCADYAVVGEVFGVSKSTVCLCTHHVIEALIHLLLSEYIRFPDENDVADICIEFEKRYFLPQVVGVIGSTHVPILAPTISHKKFVNNKGWTSLIMEAVVDHNMCFRSVTCQDPGQYHDAVLAGSSLYSRTREMMPQGCVVKEGVEIPYYIIGDQSYLLTPWLMTEYQEASSQEQALFNTYLHRALRTVDEAITRLKARWRFLLRRSELNWKFMPQVVLACAVLHNIAELNEDGFDPDWVMDVQEAETSFPQPVSGLVADNSDKAGQYARDTLCAYMTRIFSHADAY